MLGFALFGVVHAVLGELRVSRGVRVASRALLERGFGASLGGRCGLKFLGALVPKSRRGELQASPDEIAIVGDDQGVVNELRGILDAG